MALLFAMARRLQAHNCKCAPDVMETAIAILDVCEAYFQTEVTATQAAELCHLSASQIRRWMSQGRLTRLGGDGERLRTYLYELPFKRETGQEFLNAVKRLREEVDQHNLSTRSD
jgi:transposase-like protein